MAAVLAESMVGGIRFHPDVIQSEAPEFRSSTTLAHSPCLRHATGVVYLDNAFVLIEGHPLSGSLMQTTEMEGWATRPTTATSVLNLAAGSHLLCASCTIVLPNTSRNLDLQKRS